MGLPKVLVPFSGGWDSVLCAIKAKEVYEDIHLVFFDYGQPYLEAEVRASAYASAVLHLPLVRRSLVQLDADDGVFDDRNLLILQELERMGADVVYFGCRNPFPLFDKYGDSNWVWGKQQQRALGFQVFMPCVLRTKRTIGKQIQAAGLDLAMLYSTDPAAKGAM